MAAPIRIAIADDHALFRQGLKSMLRLRDDVEVVGETERADEVRAMVERSGCDVLLLDLQMDRSSIAEIPELAQRVKVVVVTASERLEESLAAIRAGARGVVLKRYAVETLIEAIRVVTAGDVWMPPSLQTAIAAGLQTPLAEGALTPREREIVRYVALGMRNAEVARKLFISEQTVKTHLNNVFQKLGVRDRVSLTRFAIRTGIVAAHERPS